MVFPHFSGSNLAEVSLSELDTIPRTPPQSSQGMAPRRICRFSDPGCLL